MQVVEALDAGDMLAKSRRRIGPDETSEELEQALAEDGARLLLHTIEQIEAGTNTPEPQDHSASSYAPRLRKDEGLIDWTRSAPEIHNQVRGLYPWPHTYSYLDGARVIVLKTQVRHTTGPLRADTTPPAGTILDVTRDAIEVLTGDGVIAITELQPEGRRPMSTRDFVAGRPVRPGMTFGS
jgi:methionyl-tRNA formyltransferase